MTLPPCRRSPAWRPARILTAGLGLAAACAGAAAAEERWRTGVPTLNLYGATGLIDMPSGQMQPDAELTVTASHFGPISRTTLSFQVTPRLSASFRFLAVGDWNAALCPPDCDGANQFETYYDRSFDLRYRLLDEGRLLPSLVVGLQDFAGTGVLAGEYLAASKSLPGGVTVTAGLGWGRLGSHGSIGSPFGTRPPIDVGEGGELNTDQWFRGPAAPFGGLEWRFAERWGLKAEYSSDAYDEEAGLRGTFAHRSPFNFGVEYQAAPGTRIGAYYMYGDVVGVAGTVALNPRRRPGGISGGAPLPVRPRPAPGAAGWSEEWVEDRGAAAALAGRLASLLDDDGIAVEHLSVTAREAEIRIRSTRLDAAPQAIGRTARAMTRVLPPSVEVFRIVPVEAGLPAAAVTLHRSALEAGEFSAAPGGGVALAVGPAGPIPPGARGPVPAPRLGWSLGPHLRTRFFDQNDPAKADIGLRGTFRLELAPGLALGGAVTQRVAGNLDDRPPLPDRGSLQPVRSAVYFYDRDGDTALERLTLDWNRRLGPALYGRVSGGYLERMFGGVAAEVLWKPAGSRLALGAEIARVAQRAPDGGFGFDLPAEMYETDGGNPGGPSSYRVTTGHLSAYYALAEGFHVRLDVGRYLAGDVGATLAIDREFANGWRIGAFATRTDASAEDFGSGSFDKGIRVEVPFAWVLGRPTRRTATTVLRPFGRDGGARLDLDGRLYDTVRGWHQPAMEAQWARFWQ